jgi:ribulose-5-phosphate 4-epimerase/fuculose-1-phosphate aldolase
VLLDRLGPNVWHRSPAEAMAVLEELEETARLWRMSTPKPLTEERIAELRRAFGAVW